MTTRKLCFFTSLLLVLLLVGCAKEGKEEKAPAPGSAAQQGGPAVAGPPVDAATITGKILFTGAAPKPSKLRMDADAACVAAHGQPVFSEDIAVNDNKTLRWVFVYVKAGLGDRTFPVPKEPVVLDQHGCLYTPHVMGVMAGQDIHITNSDQTTHNIHPVPANNREWNTSMAPGAEHLVKNFPREEILIPVKCNVHPWMKGYVGVLKHPFFAVSGPDGTFTIKGLPPGKYTIAAWQEKLGTMEQEVTVGPKETKKVDFTFKPAGGGK